MQNAKVAKSATTRRPKQTVGKLETRIKELELGIRFFKKYQHTPWRGKALRVLWEILGD